MDESFLQQEILFIKDVLNFLCMRASICYMCAGA